MTASAGTDQSDIGSLAQLRDRLREFAGERDWDQFHSPRNLAAALTVEAAELLEHFQWLTDGASSSLSEVTLAKVRLELADVLLYLVRLADKLDIDLLRAAQDKLVINGEKYPVAKARGNSRKYNEL
jgi:NTP pyrophosphatase (non-canonical NTP hydrolase)